MSAILLSDFVWEGTSTEMLEVMPGLRDGHIYKQLDTGESYFRKDSTWEFINLGLAFIKATKSGFTTTDGSGTANIVFATPFIDGLYSVMLTTDDPGKGPGINAYSSLRTAQGFRIIVRRSTSGKSVANVFVSWLCTRNYNP